MLPAKSNQDLSTPPPICWHVWSGQTCSSCAPGSKKRFTSPLHWFWRVKQTWDSEFHSSGEEEMSGAARCPPGAHRRAVAPLELVVCTRSSGMQPPSHLRSSPVVPPLRFCLAWFSLPFPSCKGRGFPLSFAR